MLKETFPIVKSALLKHKTLLIALLVISVLLGVIPTLKSELESALIDKTSQVLTSQSDDLTSGLFGIKISRFDTERDERADLPERIAYLLFGGISLGLGLLVYAVIAFIAYLLDVFAKVVQSRISRDTFAALRGEGFRKGLVISPSVLPSITNVAGQYAIAIQQGAANVGGTYGYLLEAGQYLFSLTTTIYLVSSKNFAFAVGCVVLVSGQVAISFFQARQLKQKREKLDAQRNDLVGRTDDILSKREIILAYDQQANYQKKMDSLTSDYADIERNLEVAEKKYDGLSQLITDYGRISILLFALYLAFRLGFSTIKSIGDAYFLISIYVRIFVPASNLLSRYDSMKRSEATSRTFLNVLNYKPKTNGKPSSQQHEVPESHELGIRFERVFFKYGPTTTKWVLREMNFTAPGSQTTLVLGRSGSGKTTIAKILLGFWPVNQGKVLINGIEISNIDPHLLRKKMCYVSQGDHIIDDTLRENLSWGYSTESISDNQMMEALVLLGIIDKKETVQILDLPARKLSIGQQQRLSFARMMLDKSEIIILDEPFSGVDVFTVREIAPQLAKMFSDSSKTTILFSHRLAFASYAHHIVILGDDGGISEEGDPATLLSKQGIFSRLHAAALQELQGIQKQNRQ